MGKYANVVLPLGSEILEKFASYFIFFVTFQMFNN